MLDSSEAFVIKDKYSFFSKALGGFKAFIKDLFPTSKDNFNQVIVKILFLVSVLTIIIFSFHYLMYFADKVKHEDIIEENRKIWFDKEIDVVDRYNLLLKENSDFIGWLSIQGTNIDNPVYQGKDDRFYLNHNSKQEYNPHGALFLSSTDKLNKKRSDKNLIIYGNNMTDGTMFGTLENYRNLDFYKKYPNINFSTVFGDDIYKIYAVMILNANLDDDGGYIYNIGKNRFAHLKEFDAWVIEAEQRSIITTTVDVKYGDDILTLMTDVDDFEGARLVVMARKIRNDESAGTMTAGAKINDSIRYPKRWYDDRGMDYTY